MNAVSQKGWRCPDRSPRRLLPQIRFGSEPTLVLAATSGDVFSDVLATGLPLPSIDGEAAPLNAVTRRKACSLTTRRGHDRLRSVEGAMQPYGALRGLALCQSSKRR